RLSAHDEEVRTTSPRSRDVATDRPGIAPPTARASTAPAMPTTATSTNASRSGTGVPPSDTLNSAKIAPTTAPDSDVPMDRISALTPLATPVSVGDTAAMINAGIAP